MIILIGGESCTGKTKLAHDLMRAFNIPYLSIDIVMMGLYRSNSNCGYTPLDSSYQINKYVWPILSEMIKTNIENNTKYIYEGFQIQPNSINQLEEKYRKNIFSLFLGFSAEYIEKNYAIIQEKRSIIEKRNDVDSIEKMIENNIRIKNECEKENQIFYSINKNYCNEINILINMIRKIIRRSS